MTAYIVIFLVACALALVFSTERDGPREKPGHAYAFVLAIIVLAFAIGLRENVGGDWEAYEGHFGQSRPITPRDPGYWALVYVLNTLGLGIYGLNGVAAAIFSAGLLIFCKETPLKWVGLLASIPYLAIVVAMGYTQQSMAVGFSMLAYAMALRDRKAAFLLFALLGAQFHFSGYAVVALFPFLFRFQNLVVILAVGVAAGLCLIAFYWRDLLDIHSIYVAQSYQSSGALARAGMCLVASLGYLLLVDRTTLTPSWRRFCDVMCLIGIAGFLVVALVPFTTLVDRILLYAIPFQMLVFPIIVSRFPVAVPPALVTGVIATGYFAVLLVWLLFARNAKFWLPYDNLLF